jgi:RHS repeat-associated protein
MYVAGQVTQNDSSVFDAFGRQTVESGLSGVSNYAYDLSDNITSIQNSNGVTILSAFAAGHNQLLSDTFVVSGAHTVRATYAYDHNGARLRDASGTLALFRDSWYDGIGHMVSIGSYMTYNGVQGNNCNVVQVEMPPPPYFVPVFPCHADSVFSYQGSYLAHPDACRYDALGRRTRDCNSFWVGYDGDQAVRVRGTRIIYGPGLDDPIAVYDSALGSGPGALPQFHYAVTDGAGRLLSYTDSLGTDMRESPNHVFSERAYLSGAMIHAESFFNSGSESHGTPALSYFRNRYFDQRTGRWMQEDPIGVAGGANLYGYVGDNPVTFSDPFGLCPDPLDPACKIPGIAGPTGSPGFGLGIGTVLTAIGTRISNYVSDVIDNAKNNWRQGIVAVVGSWANEGGVAEGAQVGTNPFAGPVSERVFVGNSRGSIIPVEAGQRLTASPNSEYVQVRDAAGTPTGMRLDGPHAAASHSDPRAQVPHAHVPGVTNSDGTPWLPVP